MVPSTQTASPSCPGVALAATSTERNAAGSPGPPAGRLRWHPSVRTVVAALTALAFGLRVYRIGFGYAHAVVDYDSGVYFGSALQLVHGSLPYRDYAFVQPPGITVVFAPVALLARVIGDAQAMGLTRILTALAGAASVPLVARLLRGRGLAAVTLACGVVALQTDAVTSAYTLLLEPWLVLFCLLGAVLVFDGDELAGDRRLWWGGVLFGVACAVKIWAIAPLLAVVLLLLRRRRSLGVFTGGGALGFLVPVAPFLAVAPHAFVHDVFVVQLLRTSDARTPLWMRLVHIFATAAPNAERPSAGLGALVTVAVVVLAGLVLAWSLAWLPSGRATPLDRFGALAAVLVVVLLLAPGTFYWHYAAFSAPFLALSAALPLASLRRVPLRAWTAVLTVVVLALALTVGHRDAHSYHLLDDHDVVDAVVPPGACLVSSTATAAIAEDRFRAGRGDCPALLDPFGEILVATGGGAPSERTVRSPAVTRLWLRAYAHADFVYLKVRDSPSFPTDGPAQAYLERHFRIVPVDAGGTLWRRVR